MNAIVQNILVIIALVLAIAFLIKKFFWKPKSKKACGGDNGCGCH